MATRFNNGVPSVEMKPKKTAQGRGQHTKYSATSVSYTHLTLPTTVFV